MEQKIQRSTSQKFRFWAFVSMVLLVFVHGYNLNDRYMQPWTTPGEPLTLTSFIEYFLANGIFRFRIPMLFIISGYLFAMGDRQPYGTRIGKRLRTLLIPYLIWSAFGLLLFFVLEMFPYTRNIVLHSHLAQIDQHRSLVHDYRWYEILLRWIFFPIPYQLWFIRVLLIYNIIYPWIRFAAMHRTWRWILFSIAFLMWLSTFGMIFLEGEGLLFFSIGVWMQKHAFDLERPRRWLNPVRWGMVFLSLSLFKTWLAFKGAASIGEAVYPVLSFLHKAVIFSGLVTAWHGGNALVRWAMKRKWFVWLTSFSFMIYAIHAPLVALLIDETFRWLGYIHGYRILTFFLLPLIIIVAAIITAAFLRRYLPGCYSVLTGGRGIG